jgi:hypothetical protein
MKDLFVVVVVVFGATRSINNIKVIVVILVLLQKPFVKEANRHTTSKKRNMVGQGEGGG